MTIYERLLVEKQKKGAGFLVLIDPDKQDNKKTIGKAERAEESGADAILIGGSLLFSTQFDQLIAQIKKTLHIPVIIFPGSLRQISSFADAILFLVLISGRNPNNLIGEQVLAAPIIKALGIEPISTGYMLIESGRATSAEYISNTRPIPRHKPDIAIAHALAAEYMGMKFAYLEAGSGADMMVPNEIIAAVVSQVSIPVIVGGGIRKPEDASEKSRAGASFIVIGNVLEKKDNDSLINEFADAIHFKT
ncbi:geranylgeranylglyceryl/heptaprenylglyceryl phosphate synthase [candidate division KSB1 bacterium]|nr:geranylgeranylglyceryl/heptaprenylglyceryl phosphate synthase [candidate division KSB1 bacterium]